MCKTMIESARIGSPLLTRASIPSSRMLTGLSGRTRPWLSLRASGLIRSPPLMDEEYRLSTSFPPAILRPLEIISADEVGVLGDERVQPVGPDRLEHLPAFLGQMLDRRAIEGT